MTDITIPPEVVEAAAIAIYISVYPAPDYFSWAETPEYTRRIYINHARAAIVAALNAWEGAKTLRDDGRRQTYAIPAIILPLPQEPKP